MGCGGDGSGAVRVLIEVEDVSDDQNTGTLDPHHWSAGEQLPSQWLPPLLQLKSDAESHLKDFLGPD